MMKTLQAKCRPKYISTFSRSLCYFFFVVGELHGDIDKFKPNIIPKKIPQITTFYTSLYGFVGKKMKTIIIWVQNSELILIKNKPGTSKH